MTNPVVAVLGTGVMGAGMVRSLRRADVPVRMWNRDGDKARALTPTGAEAFDSPAEAVAGADVVLTTGGTGLTPTDVTPEATRAVLQREAPGIAEAIRRYGQEQVPTSVLSRGLAGTCSRTLIVNLPGSTGGVRDGLTVLGPLLPHVVSQLRGGDHGPGAPAPGP
ncbi:hypothetical protein A7K94_0208130 [Modestobacter sp. VKM Ac-2676]|nr:hypothetical protein A7K94_0208130 [Modestobacter sp. VKM Ac-2676]